MGQEVTSSETTDDSGVDYQECYAVIHKLACRAASAKSEWDSAKAVASEKKAVYDRAASELIEYGSDEPSMPLFDVTPEDSAWRAVGIEELAISDAVVAKLLLTEISTVGDLVDFQKKHGETWTQELDGIGPQKGAEIDEAMAKFWEAHAPALTDDESQVLADAQASATIDN